MENPDSDKIRSLPEKDKLDTPVSVSEADTIPEHKVKNKKAEITINDVRLSLFVDLIYQTSFLPPPSKAISALLIGSAGTGKTKNLEKLRSEKHVYYTNVISPKFLIKFVDRVSKGEKSMIVIPDFLTATDGSKTTRENLIKLLRVIIEEGLDDASHYGYPEVHYNSPIRAGLLTAITYDGINEFKRAWKQSGFLSRLIPFSYSLSAQLRNEIENKIKGFEALNEKEKLPTLKKNIINRTPKQVSLPESLAFKLDVCAYKLATVTGSTNAPFRQEKQIYTLAKAHCALRHAEIVEQIDVDTIIMLSNWLNLDFNKL